MVLEFVVAGLILMLIWWLFKSGFIWAILGVILIIATLIYFASIN